MHHSVKLQRAWAKHGASGFAFEVVEYIGVAAELLEREQFWIEFYRAADARVGYNVCSIAGSREGVQQPPSVAEKMRAFHTGKPKSAETRAKISAARTGHPMSAAAKEKLRACALRQFADLAARERNRQGLKAYYATHGSPLKGRPIAAASKELSSRTHKLWAQSDSGKAQLARMCELARIRNTSRPDLLGEWP